MIHRRLVYAALFLINAGVFVASNTKTALITAAVMAVLPLLSFIHLSLFAKSLKADCCIEPSTDTGKALYAALSLYTPFWLIPGKIFFMSSCFNKMFSTLEKQQVLIKIKHGSNLLKIPFESPVCGKIDYKISGIQCCDMLHLFKKEIRFHYEKEITVYPAPIQVNAVFSRSFSVEREGQVYDKHKKGSDHSEILELRKYRYGDNVKNIHWKLSSKLGETMVREFSRPNNLNTLIICNISMNQNGADVSEKDVSDSVGLTEAVSLSMTEQGVGHSVCTITENGINMIGIENMSEHARMVNELIGMKADRSGIDPGLAFLNLGSGCSFSKIIYITRDYNPETARLMSQNVDLTIIITNNGDKNVFETNDSYEIVSLSSDGLRKGIHNIQL